MRAEEPPETRAEEAGCATAGPSPSPRLREFAGEVWEDAALGEWPEDDHRLFVGNLGPEVDDDMLGSAFRAYASFERARVVRDRARPKARAYGFVGFRDASDMAAAMAALNGSCIGNRPCVVKRSTWRKREARSAETPPSRGKRRKHLPTLPRTGSL
jgi:RNA recognition motif-containing protein